MVDIYLFRHAHVDYQPPAPITAHNPLTPLGHQMAERLARRCEGWDLQYLFVSTMLRAQQTARAIAERLPHIPWRDMPEFEELSIRDLEGFVGELPSEDLLQWREEHFAYANEAMWRRVLAGWEEVERVIAAQGLERVAIVGHGGSLNILLRHFLGGSVVRLRTCWIDLDWTATSCLHIADDGEPIQRSIRWVNDASHIADLRHLIPQS